MFIFTTNRQPLTTLYKDKKHASVNGSDCSRTLPYSIDTDDIGANTNRSAAIIQWWSWFGCNVLLMGLFVEWLLPFYQSSYLSMSVHINTWLIPVGAALLIGLCCSSKWLKSVLICTTILLVSTWSSVEEGTWLEGLASMPWQLVQTIQSWMLDIQGISVNLIRGDAYHYSDVGEIAIILLFIMLLSLLVQSLMNSSYSVNLFSAATIVYLLLMEKIMGLDTGDGLVRAFIWTMIAVAWLQLQRQRDEIVKNEAAWPTRWWMSTMSLAVMLVIGYMLWMMTFTSSSPTVWPALESWVQEKFEKLMGDNDRLQGRALQNGRSIAEFGMTGYGQDDSQLGMPIKPNKAVLFRATTPHSTYWRVESKRMYSGQGWEARDDGEQRSINMEQAALPNRNRKPNMELAWSNPFEQHLRFEQFPAGMPLLHGGKLLQVLPSGEQIEAANYQRQAETDIAVANRNKQTSTIASFNLGQAINHAAEARDYTVKVSRFIDTPASFAGLTDTDDSEEIKRLYTELPDHLPKRITELSAQLMNGASNRYERVERVQRYLLENYMYTTEATSVPEGEADFVDHFLFEQRQGYCVHFSTAMAVMLRTQGIPTRWVKGFAPGEKETDGTYTVRHSDAHAWVEVYFPELGWVPFDPTPARGVVPDGEQAVVTIPARADVIQGEAVSYELNAQLYDSMLGGTAMAGDSILADIQKWMNSRWEAAYSVIHTGVEKLIKSTSSAWKQLLVELGAWHHQVFWSDWRSTLSSFWQADSWMHLWSAYPISVSTAASLMLVMIVCLSVCLKVSISRKYPIWTLRHLLRMQQRSYSRSRALRIGELGWVVIQRRLGQRLPGMTMEEYVQVGCEKMGSKLTSSERDALEKFIVYSNEVLYAAMNEWPKYEDDFGRICSELFQNKKRRAADL